MIKTPLKFIELTNAEFNVWKEVVVFKRGNKEAGEKLFVAEKTIKYHLTNIFKKHRVKGRDQLRALYKDLPKDDEPITILPKDDEPITILPKGEI